jgi:Uma2 family endonuclease
LIVEILSKGTENKDYKEKFEIYEESGVQEYWIVSIDNRSVLVYRLGKEAKYVADRQPYVTGDTVKVGIFDNLSVSVEEVVEGLLEFDD